MVDGSYKSLVNTIRVRHETLIPGLRYLFDNEPDDRDETLPYIRLTFDFDDADDRVFGKTYRVRKSGEIISKIHIPLEDGDEAALQEADSIASAMRQTDADGVFYGNPSVRAAGREGAFWMIEVRTPFHSDFTYPAPARVGGSTATIEAVHDRIRSRFGTQVEDVMGFKVLYDNADPSVIPVDQSLWVRFAVSTGLTQVGQQSTAVKTYRTTGHAFAMIMAKAETGDSETLDVVDGIDSAFRGVNDSGIRYGPVSLDVIGRATAGESGGTWFQHNVAVPFYFEVNS